MIMHIQDTPGLQVVRNQVEVQHLESEVHSADRALDLHVQHLIQRKLGRRNAVTPPSLPIPKEISIISSKTIQQEKVLFSLTLYTVTQTFSGKEMDHPRFCYEQLGQSPGHTYKHLSRQLDVLITKSRILCTRFKIQEQYRTITMSEETPWGIE